MPTAMTFDSLQEDLRKYMERGEVTDVTVYDQLPRLINNAEREIAQDIKILGFLEPLTSNFVAGQSLYAKPDRWRQTVSMNFGISDRVLPPAIPQYNVRRQLFPRGYEYMRYYWPDSNLRGMPKFYADYDYGHWLIAPTPDFDYPWEVNSYMLPPLLDATNQTNWLTDYASTMLLYRCLMECMPFLKQDERTQTFGAMYEASKGKLNLQDIKRITDRNTTRESA